VEKYGTDLTRDDVDFFGWVEHLQEELLDAANYCECLLSGGVAETERTDRDV
jgi:hypothetical protein